MAFLSSGAAENIKNFLFSFGSPAIVIAIGLFFISILICGFQLLFGGNQGKENAKLTFIVGVAGLVIVVLARDIVNEIYTAIFGKGF
jgi:hypothetical protein